MSEDKKSNVIKISHYYNDASYALPHDALEDAMEDLKEGGQWEGIDKALIIALDTRDGNFDIEFINSNMSLSQILAALKLMEIRILQECNRLPYSEED